MRWSKNISATKRLAAFILAAIQIVIGRAIYSSSAAEHDNKAGIYIVYPKPEQEIAAVDSTFILGHIVIPENYKLDKLKINNHEVAVHRDGGFLAFLPIMPGEFTFYLEAYLVQRTYAREWRQRLLTQTGTEPDSVIRLRDSITVRVPEPLKPLSIDSLYIVQEYHPPTGDIAVKAGDVLQVCILGTPGCRAWFNIPGVVDSVPMVEMEPQEQPYWGESVFGAGSVPDSMRVAGIYCGFYEAPCATSAESTHIVYHLAPPPRAEIIARFILPPYDSVDMRSVEFLRFDDTVVVRKESSYAVSINDPSYPFAVRFIDSVQIIRHGPGKGYLSIFQPEGVEALVIGAEGEWYKIKLSETQVGWVKKASVERLPKGILPPKSYLRSIRMYGDEEKLIVRCPLAGRHPFRVVEDDKRTVRIYLFGVISNTDWIRYDFSDRLVRLATWSQLEDGLYELKLQLAQDLWGYDAYYEGNTFCFQINKPPDNLRSLRGKTIVIDPGHSKDPGAIGPTGYTEAEANLAIALELKRRLQYKGAKVILTREDTSHVELYERPMIAKAHDADLFVSIHNNAVPDDVNPFANNGTSTYYYHPHSIELARSIHAEMVKATELPDYGLYHANFAVNRPTQYPAVLVECAFMIIPEQEAMLKTDKFRKRIAKAITNGIKNFLKEYNSE
ncbi:MAG: N-acetylmuramoyl-L-alanine amidase [Candidatus Zixiibacteriota bacterium]